MPKPAIGLIPCGYGGCKRMATLRVQSNGRFYGNCDGLYDRSGPACGSHLRTPPAIIRKEQLEGYQPLPDPETRNVTEPEPEATPAPVTTTPKEEPVTDVRSKKRGGIFAALN